MGRKPQYLRNPHHRGFLNEYYNSLDDHRENPLIPTVRKRDWEIMRDGVWADIPRERRFRKIWKERRLLLRRQARKFRGK